MNHFLRYGLLGLMLLLLVNVFTGSFGSSTLCQKGESCSLADTVMYLTSTGSTLEDNTYLKTYNSSIASIFQELRQDPILETHAATITGEIDNGRLSIETEELLQYKARSTELTNEELTHLRYQLTANFYDALLTYLQEEELELKNNIKDRLQIILPRELSSLEAIDFLTSMKDEAASPENPLAIRNFSVDEAPVQETGIEALSISFQVEGAKSAYLTFLDILDSTSDLTQAFSYQASKYPLMSLTSLKTTYHDKETHINEVEAGMEVTFYTVEPTKGEIERLEKEVLSLENATKELTNAPLEALIMEEKNKLSKIKDDARAYYESLNTLKELYQELANQ